jgi:hypothetical protein
MIKIPFGVALDILKYNLREYSGEDFMVDYPKFITQLGIPQYYMLDYVRLYIEQQYGKDCDTSEVFEDLTKYNSKYLLRINRYAGSDASYHWKHICGRHSIPHDKLVWEISNEIEMLMREINSET